jgi:hypothetical protein
MDPEVTVSEPSAENKISLFFACASTSYSENDDGDCLRFLVGVIPMAEPLQHASMHLVRARHR